MANLLKKNLVWRQAPKLTLSQKIKRFFEPIISFFTGLTPRERELAEEEAIPATKVRLPFAKKPTVIRPKEAPLISMPIDIAGRLIEAIPKAVVSTIQNYKEIKAKGKAKPLKLPFDARRLGFEAPEVKSTGRRLVEKFNQVNKLDPPKNDFDVWKNAALSSLMVVVPDAFDAFIAGEMAELGAKTVLKATKYDPVLERATTTLGLRPNQRFTGKEFMSRIKESLLQSKTVEEYADTIRSARYIIEKGTTTKIPIIPRFLKKIQDTARNLILPLEQWGKGYQVRPIAEMVGLPGYVSRKGGLAITPRVGGEIPPKPPIKPPIPPSPPQPEMPEFMGKKPKGLLEDPITKLNELLKRAKPLRKKLEKEYTAERAKRIANVEKFINEQIDKVGGEEGYAKILAKLKGELVSPEAKVAFEPIKEKLTEDQIKELFKRTWKHPYLDNWEKISTASGLMDLLSGGIPKPKQLILIEEVYGTELVKNILSKRLMGAKAADFLIELANLPRMFLATADMSALLRQGVIGISHPVIYSKSAAKTFQFAFSPKSFEQWFKDLPKDPLYPLMRKAKLSITDPTKVAGGLSEREEAFISRILQKIPIIGIPVRFAERSYVGFLNKLRVDWFKNWADELLSKGYSPAKDVEIFKAAANVVNTFTGRGSLGRLNRITPELNIIFFSPRLQAARFNALNPIWYARMPKEIRKKAISDFAKFVAAGLTTLAIMKIWKEANNLSDNELSIESDPRSSDFGKIKVGNTRYDIWGGFQQWARVFAQLITGERKNTATGEIVSLTKDEYPFTTRKEVLLRFIEGKLAPVPALINELMSGAKTFTGEDMTFKTTAKEKFIPMYIQDIAEAYADGGLGRAIGSSIAAFLGIGVQTWQERKKISPTPGLPSMPGLPQMPGLPGTKLPTMPGIFK